MPSPGQNRFLVRVTGALLLSASTACALPSLGGSASEAPDTYRIGLAQLERGELEAADATLRRVAACGPEEEVVAAFLLLAFLQQDPRHPGAHPDSAALMAARLLHLPPDRPDDQLLAEGLYVLALDRGGDPGLRPEPGDPLLDAGPECRSRRAPGERIALPVLSTPPRGLRLERARGRADSLARRLEVIVGEREAAEARVQELEAELTRIRRLLQEPDTLGRGGSSPR